MATTSEKLFLDFVVNIVLWRTTTICYNVGLKHRIVTVSHQISLVYLNTDELIL